MGRYKGVKVIFSEARLYTKGNRRDPVFSGLFALLEIPQEIFEGHTIITADPSMVARWQHSRWQKLSPVTLSPAQKSHDRFSAFSDQPQEAVSVLGERLIKELAEASEIFDDAALSAVFFRGKYVFLAIPYPHDMFEASNLHVPVTTSQYAMTCKKEVEKLLEIIDVFDLYKSQLAD